MRAPESPECAPQFPGPKRLKKRVCDLPYSILSEKLQNIFEIGLNKYGVFLQKLLSLKKYFERKNSQTVFLFMC